MKTRQEMIYDFMLALCGDFGYIAKNYGSEDEDTSILFYEIAAEMADEYLKNLG